jgi:hypothetical protein
MIEREIFFKDNIRSFLESHLYILIKIIPTLYYITLNPRNINKII